MHRSDEEERMGGLSWWHWLIIIGGVHPAVRREEAAGRGARPRPLAAHPQVRGVGDARGRSQGEAVRRRPTRPRDRRHADPARSWRRRRAQVPPWSRPRGGAAVPGAAAGRPDRPAAGRATGAAAAVNGVPVAEQRTQLISVGSGRSISSRRARGPGVDPARSSRKSPILVQDRGLRVRPARGDPRRVRRVERDAGRPALPARLGSDLAQDRDHPAEHDGVVARNRVDRRGCAASAGRDRPGGGRS